MFSRPSQSNDAFPYRSVETMYYAIHIAEYQMSMFFVAKKIRLM